MTPLFRFMGRLQQCRPEPAALNDQSTRQFETRRQSEPGGNQQRRLDCMRRPFRWGGGGRLSRRRRRPGAVILTGRRGRGLARGRLECHGWRPCDDSLSATRTAARPGSGHLRLPPHDSAVLHGVIRHGARRPAAAIDWSAAAPALGRHWNGVVAPVAAATSGKCRLSMATAAFAMPRMMLRIWTAPVLAVHAGGMAAEQAAVPAESAATAGRCNQQGEQEGETDLGAHGFSGGQTREGVEGDRAHDREGARTIDKLSAREWEDFTDYSDKAEISGSGKDGPGPGALLIQGRVLAPSQTPVLESTCFASCRL